MRRLLTACALFLLITGGLARAELNIGVVLSEGDGAYLDYYNQLVSQLARVRPDARPRRLEPDTLARQASGSDLLIAVGTRAAAAVAQADNRPPVLQVLLTRRSFEDIARRNGRSPGAGYSAIFLDQPAGRQFELIRAALPQAQRVAVLLGPESADTLPELENAARRVGLQLVNARVEQAEDIVPALNRLLTSADLLLTYPDSVAYSRDTAQPVLLTAYRHRRPVFAFSRAYVTAGALAAVYSSPEDIARQSAELIATVDRGGRIVLPPPRHPTYHSLTTNQNVARSLGLNVPDESVLSKQLQTPAKDLP